MSDLTSCPPPKGKACVKDSERLGLPFCVDSGDCVTLKIRLREIVNADCTAASSSYQILDENNAVIGVHTGSLVRVQCEALRVKIVDSCDTVTGPPVPGAALSIEFAETLLYSASTEQALVRIRQYSEATGIWTLRYEELNGTAFTGALPADLVAQTAQVNVTRTALPGCANGQPFTQYETTRFDAETGVPEGTSTEWVNAVGGSFSVQPVGFLIGSCPDPDLLDFEYVNSVGCADGVYTPRLDIYGHNTTTGAVVAVATQYLTAGVWQALTPANWLAGPCPALPPAASETKRVCPGAAQGASGVFSGIYATITQGSAWSSADLTGIQSITITAIKAQGAPFGPNAIFVSLGGGFVGGGLQIATTTLRLTEEFPSYTWSVAQDNASTAEFLGQGIQVDAVGDAAFVVTWTADCNLEQIPS